MKFKGYYKETEKEKIQSITGKRLKGYFNEEGKDISLFILKKQTIFIIGIDLLSLQKIQNIALEKKSYIYDVFEHIKKNNKIIKNHIGYACPN